MSVSIEHWECFQEGVENCARRHLLIHELQKSSWGLSSHEALLHRRRIITHIASLAVTSHRDWFSQNSKQTFDRSASHFLNHVYWSFYEWGFEQRCWFEMEFCRIYLEQEQHHSLLRNPTSTLSIHFPLSQFFFTFDKIFDSVHHQNNIHAEEENWHQVLTYRGHVKSDGLLSEKAFFLLDEGDVSGACRIIAQKVFLTFLNYFCHDLGFCALGHQFFGWVNPLLRFNEENQEKIEDAVGEEIQWEVEKVCQYMLTYNHEFQQDKFKFFKDLLPIQLHFLCYKGLCLYADQDMWEPVFRGLVSRGLTVSLALNAMEREEEFVDHECSVMMKPMGEQVLSLIERCNLSLSLPESAKEERGKDRL